MSESTTNYLNILISVEQGLDVTNATPSIAGEIKDQIEHLRKINDNVAKIRIITSASNSIEYEVANQAKELGCELHILTSLACTLTLGPEALKPERFVSLVNEEDLHDNPELQESINEVRDEIALDFADLVIVAWNESNMNDARDPISSLVLKALQMSLPVISVMQKKDSQGELGTKYSNPKDIEEKNKDFIEFSQFNLIDISSNEDYFNSKRPNGFGQLPENAVELNSEKQSQEKRWRGPAEEPIEGVELDKPDKVWDVFDTADVKAGEAQDRHKQTIYRLHYLSASAVGLAVLGSVLNSYGFSDTWIAAVGVLELMVLFLIIALLKPIESLSKWLMKHKRLETLAECKQSDSPHHDWLTQRYIAEQIRYWAMTYPILGSHRNNNSPNCISNALHRLYKNQGLPYSKSGYSPVGKHISLASKIKESLKDQIDYHEKKHQDTKKQHIRFEYGILIVFGITFFTVVSHVLHLIHTPAILIITAGFPAFAGAIHAIGSKLELERITNQHKSTKETLKKRLNTLILLFPECSEKGAQLSDSPLCTMELSDTIRFIKLRKLASLCAQDMSEENQQWQQLLLSQEAGLPA